MMATTKTKRKPKTVWTNPKYKGELYMGKYAKVKVKGSSKKERALVLQKVSGGRAKEFTFESHQMAKDLGWKN